MTERFTLLARLGRGGMGVVWQVRDEESGAIVALKLLHSQYADDPEYLERFSCEVELARRVHSSHVVAVLGYGTREGVPYLVMEYIEGPSLRERLAAGPLAPGEARALLLQLAQGLADVHGAGVVHRDLTKLCAPRAARNGAWEGLSRPVSRLGAIVVGIVGKRLWCGPSPPTRLVPRRAFRHAGVRRSGRWWHMAGLRRGRSQRGVCATYRTQMVPSSAGGCRGSSRQRRLARVVAGRAPAPRVEAGPDRPRATDGGHPSGTIVLGETAIPGWLGMTHFREDVRL